MVHSIMNFLTGNSGSSAVHALSIFKEAIFEDPTLVLSNWNTLDEDPCNWFGITCSRARVQVLKINISGANLKGFLARELYRVDSLEELILHGNYLIGTIPKEVGMLKDLKVLDLGMNQLSGPIPPEIGNLTSIVTINLQSNGLTGRLPPELGNLKYLEELRLDRNKLQGSVPGTNTSDFASNTNGLYVSNANSAGFCRSSQLKVADFSYNFFVGSIPKCLEYLPSSSFQGNCLQDTNPKQRPTKQCGYVGIAKGLRYLHAELEPPFTISELNSSSVYLTEDFSPKLVDFERWKTILSRSEKNSGAISNEGAICFLSNSLEGRHLDIQGNIYAFGVLLLEIISGRPPYCEDKGCLVDWAKEYLEQPDVMSYVVDPELKHFVYDDLKVICEVATLCIYRSPNHRVSMQDLCTMLESKIDTSVSAELRASSLAWAELALSS